MATADQNFTMWAGEALTIRIPVTDDDGAPVALTGASLAWAIVRAHGADALVTKTSGGGGITLEDGDGTDDVAVVALEPEDTQGLAGQFRHELAITGAQAAGVARGIVAIERSTLLGA